MENQQYIQEDEIDLRSYINVIIKRKNLVLTVFLVSVIIAVIAGFFIPKRYEISMIIEPPIITVTSAGVQNLDSVENIVAKIQQGAFDKKIIEELNIKNTALGFKVYQPKDTRLIKISLFEEIKKTDLGIVILNKLIEKLSYDYQKIIQDKKKDIENQISTTKSQIDRRTNEIKSKEEQFKIKEDREQGLLEEIKEIKSNSEKLLAERKILLKVKEGEGDISSLLYTTTINQSIRYFTELQNELATLKVDKEEIKTSIKNLESDITSLKIQIEDLDILKNEIHNIGLIQEPQVSLHHMSRNGKLIVINSAILSLILGVFLAFFIEWWQNYPKNVK